jgi:hypothetical protein
MATHRVGDEFRTNSLSLIPGGKKVTVVYSNGVKLVYDKVKNPGKYIKSISEKDSPNGAMMEILVEGKSVWTNQSTRNPWDI